MSQREWRFRNYHLVELMQHQLVILMKHGYWNEATRHAALYNGKPCWLQAQGNA